MVRERLEKRVTELPKIAVRRLDAATDAVHPDPDVIAAFAERSLGERERDQVLGHLAQCSECREVVALSCPQHEAAVPAAPAPAWLAWPVLRWGALAACVVVVGAAVTLRHPFRETSPPGSPTERADTAKVAQEAVPTTLQPDARVVPAPKATVPQAFEAKQDLGSVEKKVETADKESARGLVAAAKTKNLPAPTPGLRDQGPTVAVRSETAEVRVATDAMSPTSPNALDEAVPGRAKDALERMAPGVASAAGGPMAAKASASAALNATGANKMALTASPRLSPRWTLSADGTLQRSLDSGRTWETVHVPSEVSFRALAADGLEIWVGGAKGALYHSSNAGQDWTQVQPSAKGEVLSDDITRVEFTDRLHGTVATSGQQKWVTTDAGQSWQKQ
ncbi:MAG: YCF48-related protein [Terriglobales bacterium]